MRFSEILVKKTLMLSLINPCEGLTEIWSNKAVAHRHHLIPSGLNQRNGRGCTNISFRRHAKWWTSFTRTWQPGMFFWEGLGAVFGVNELFEGRNRNNQIETCYFMMRGIQFVCFYASICACFTPPMYIHTVRVVLPKIFESLKLTKKNVKFVRAWGRFSLTIAYDPQIMDKLYKSEDFPHGCLRYDYFWW